MRVKTELVVYWVIYVPTLTYDHGLVCEGKKSLQIQEEETSFLHKVSGLSLRKREKSLVIWECSISDVFWVSPQRPCLRPRARWRDDRFGMADCWLI